MENKNLLTLDLQKFTEGDVESQESGENEVETTAESQTEETESEVEETGEENGNAEPPKQTDEENARYAAIRRRAEEDARNKYQSEMNALNQRVAAMCQGVTHPLTGQPITNVNDYMDALQIQQRQANEQELQEKGVDPQIIDRMIAQNPVVMQAQQVIEQNKMVAAENALQRDLAEITKFDPNIKGINDLAALPNFSEMLDRVSHGMSLVDAYKIVNYGKSTDAARQQAINQMRGKDHLATQSGVEQDEEYVEVPAEIMSRWKSEGKTEKQIRELYKTVKSKLHIG